MNPREVFRTVTQPPKFLEGKKTLVLQRWEGGQPLLPEADPTVSPWDEEGPREALGLGATFQGVPRQLRHEENHF